MKLLIIIPCYDEEDGIGKVISDIPRERLRRSGYETDILVIDNNSKDKTAEIAKSMGAMVIHEPKQGKGNAIITAFNSIPDKYQVIAMIDGDASYNIQEIHRLLEPIETGFCNVVVGTRLHGRMTEASMTGFNRIGNWFFTFLARVCYKTNVTDVCSGFFVWRKEVIFELRKYLESNSFSIEMEMITKMARMGYKCFSVPISYTDREGTSSLRPIKDGIDILHAWLRNLRWTPTVHPKPIQPLAVEPTSEQARAYYGDIYLEDRVELKL